MKPVGPPVTRHPSLVTYNGVKIERTGGGMNRSSGTGQRLAAVFLFGCILLNYPILFLFNRQAEVFETPLLYAYIFGVWAVLIGLLAYIIERRRD